MDATRCPDPDALLVLLYDDEGTPAERAALEAHLASCRECSTLVSSLDLTRGVLGAWHAPRLPLGFAIVRDHAASPARAWLWRSGLAAAAVLVLAAAASLARLEITYDSRGLTLRTGQTREAPVAASNSPTPLASPAAPGAGASSAGSQEWVEAATAANPAWRADLDLMEARLRSEFTRALEARPATTAPMMVRAAVAPTPDADAQRRQIEDILRRVQELLDQSEIRQQQNLALRVNELGRQFQIQRQSDIDQMEQTLTRIEQQRSELLRRVASTQPRP
jgi:hypothetical protein